MKIYSSGESAAEVRFNFLHKECGSRLKQHYVCSKEGVEVPRTEMVRGYEFAKDQYVIFSDEEIKALQEKATQTIDIAEFLPTKKIDPIYFEKSYYLGPDKGGDRAFRLLVEALKKSGRSALARYAARGKQYLVMLRPVERGLVMQQLRYADEIRPIGEVPLGEAEIKPAELELALQIIEQGVSESFRPKEYEDDVRKRILAQIERKIEGKEITEGPPEQQQAQVIDLMEALKASLAAKSSERKPAKRAPREVKAAAGKKKAAGGKRSRG